MERGVFDAGVAEETERRHLAQALHDRVSQALALARLELASLRVDLLGERRRGFDKAVALIEQAARDTSEILFELSPPILYDLGLEAALAWLAEDLEKRFGVRVAVNGDGAHAPLDDATKAVVFRTIRGLLRNVRERAEDAEVQVTLRLAEGELCIDIADRGVPRHATLARVRVPLIASARMRSRAASDELGADDS